MQVRMVNHLLTNRWRYGQDSQPIVPGTKVMPANGSVSVGVIVDISNAKDEYNDKIPATVTVMWVTGGRKGKQVAQSPRTLVDFQSYFNEIEKGLLELKALEQKVKEFGT